MDPGLKGLLQRPIFTEIIFFWHRSLANYSLINLDTLSIPFISTIMSGIVRPNRNCIYTPYHLTIRTMLVNQSPLFSAGRLDCSFITTGQYNTRQELDVLCNETSIEISVHTALRKHAARVHLSLHD